MPVRAPRRKQDPLLAQLFGLVVLVGLAILVGLFLFAGADPFGFFSDDTPTQTEAAAATPIPEADPQAGPVLERWWEVYFSEPGVANDPDNLEGTIPEKLIELINGAQRTIHIASFEFDLTPVAEALIAAHQRGVEVLWLTDDDYGIDADEDVDRGQFNMLLDAGIEVRYDERSGLMHDKFWLFDGETVWTSSTNITESANFKQNNNVIVVHSPDVARIYEYQFADMWVGKLGPDAPSRVPEQIVAVEDTVIQVLFSPEDDVLDHLIPLVAEAKKDVRFMAFTFTHEGLTEAMLDRARAGVDIRGIFEKTGSQTEYSAMPKLYCAGIAVRQDGNSGFFHHKVIVIDGEIVIVGSLNFTNNADESNNENVLVIWNSEIARQYLGEFDRRWAEAVKPDAADMNCKQNSS